MFSDADLKHIIHHFPPSKDQSGTKSSLVFSSDGQSLVTFGQLKAEFQSCVTRDIHRIPVSSLASNLCVDQDVIFELLDDGPGLALLSLDKKDVVTLDERNKLDKALASLLKEKPLSKLGFASDYNLATKTVDILLGSGGEEVIESDDWVWTKSYEDDISVVILNLLRRSLEKVEVVNIVPRELPGLSPVWFATRILHKVLGKHNLAQDFHVQDDGDSIFCTPKQAAELKKEARLDQLKSGALAYVNIQDFWKDFPELYLSFAEVYQVFESLPYIEIIDSFAVSKAWISGANKDCVAKLDRDGLIDLTQQLRATFPTSLRGWIVQRLADLALASFDNRPVLIGEFILTATRRDTEHDLLLEHANANAAAQWQQLTTNPDLDLKFQLAKIIETIPTSQPVLSALLQDKATQKAIEEGFWVAISQHEVQNEADFAVYWNERVASRYSIYNEGLAVVEDQKLHDQLAELLATHAHKELVPDAIAKARTQGLVLSRKTRRNLLKLDTKISSTDKSDLSSLASTLDRFSKNQVLQPASSSVQDASKQAMMHDMHRRMHKQKKSDGPALFLTLIILLFAYRFPGVIYATGKFAPKLLKQLKGTIDEETYEILEQWKEIAKTSELTAKDREEMRKLVGA